MSDDKYLTKIAALLRQAERASTDAEREAYMQKAQELASATQISVAVARAHTAKEERRDVQIQKSIKLGHSGKRGLRQYVNLGLAIAGANDVRCDIAQNSTTLYLFGFERDIEVVEVLLSSLLYQMVESANAFIKSGAHKNEIENVYVEGRYRSVAKVNDYGERYTDSVWVPGRYTDRPVHGAVARRTFMESFTDTVSSRLRQARQRAVDEAKAAERLTSELEAERNFAENSANPTQSGVELALVAKSVEVRDFYKAHSRAKGSWVGSRTSYSGYSSSGARAGAEAGSRARLGTERALGA